MSTIRITLLDLLLAVSSVPALAQHRHAPTASPYARYERRAVKVLSNQQGTGLRAGRRMGYALVAELNGYPGPHHVLEHTDLDDLVPCVVQARGFRVHDDGELFARDRDTGCDHWTRWKAAQDAVPPACL